MSLAILSVSPFSVGGKYPSPIADSRMAKYAVCVPGGPARCHARAHTGTDLGRAPWEGRSVILFWSRAPGRKRVFSSGGQVCYWPYGDVRSLPDASEAARPLGGSVFKVPTLATTGRETGVRLSRLEVWAMVLP